MPASLSPKSDLKKYVRAVSPRLRILLYVIFALAAVLGANAVYLAAVSALEWFTGQTYQNYFYQIMFLAHLALGLLFIAPFVVFGVLHLLAARNRRNRRAVRIGYALFAVSLMLLASGLLLTRVSGFDLRQPFVRSAVYWMHVLAPVAACWLYWLHRLAGPRIKWRVGLAYVGAVAAVVLVMVALQSQDPRDWNAVGPASGSQYFEPSLARTTSGNFIPASALMNDAYCQKCHADVHAGWADSVHHFSSFNNPPYLASVMETRAKSLERAGSVQASRWCAGCHDPVPFFSGAFDDPQFDVINDPTSQAGVTCTVCHAITHINSTKGNADYTIEEPLHYPFAYSENPALQWINQQLVKAKPSFHKRTFLKPEIHRSAEFCSTCHKVHLPAELTQYKEFLRGQNHYDTYFLSGVSGHGSRSFYYPAKAKTNCSQCHMPLVASNDFGAQVFEGAKELSIHDHLFPSANTGVAWLRNKPRVVAAHQNFLQGTMRVDLFGLRVGGEIDSPLIAPLRPESPSLTPGETYLFETVIRTLRLGHPFTQGTADSNEIWLDVTVTSGDQVIGRSGALDADDNNQVDPWSHFVNVFLLDKDGNRIATRNAEDIFTPLYNHQIPPGAGQTVHYELALPENLSGPVTVEVKLQYRKFDTHYMQFVAAGNAKLGRSIRGYKPGQAYFNDLPITTLAADSFTFGIEGGKPVSNPPREIPSWERWNDYGIGLLLKGSAELRQAAEAFTEVEALGRYDGPLNLARTYNTEGRIDDAVAPLNRAAKFRNEQGFPRWTWAWLSGVINRQQGHLEKAERDFRSVLEDRSATMTARRFDFSADYEVINLLGLTLFDLGQLRARQKRPEESKAYFSQAIEEFEKTLSLDSENVTVHYNLQRLYLEQGDQQKADHHAALHARYKPDDNAQGRAVQRAKEKYPAANYAAEAVVKYQLSGDPPLVGSDENPGVRSADEK